MEWLFGSIKKKTASPEVYVSNTVEGDFTVISRGEPARPPYPLYPNIPLQGRTPAPYPQSSQGYHLQQQPYLQQQHQYQQQPYKQHVISSNTVEKPVNPLDSIPFKISSLLDSKSLPINEYQLKSIKSQLDSISNRINSDSYSYTFELERSVLSEMNCR